jgi:hypothetical protein
MHIKSSSLCDIMFAQVHMHIFLIFHEEKSNIIYKECENAIVENKTYLFLFNMKVILYVVLLFERKKHENT